VLGLDRLAGEIALRVQGRPRLAGGAGGEDDQGAIGCLKLRRLDRSLLRAVLVHRIVDLLDRHRCDAVWELGQEVGFAHRK
jgi:hypothetical protein